MPRLESFYTTLRRNFTDMPVILTGERLTPDFQSPVTYRLDARSVALTGTETFEVLHPEIVEDSPAINVFNARQEAEKQAPRAPKVKPKPTPEPELATQLTLDFTAPTPTPAPEKPTIPETEAEDRFIFRATTEGWQNTKTGEIATPGIRLDAEDMKTLRKLREHQIALYGEQWVRQQDTYRREVLNA